MSPLYHILGIVSILGLILSGCATVRHPDSVTVAENVDKHGHHDGNWVAAGWNWK